MVSTNTWLGACIVRDQPITKCLISKFVAVTGQHFIELNHLSISRLFYETCHIFSSNPLNKIIVFLFINSW